MGRIDECRRISLILGVLFTILSLWGTDLPWSSLSESDKHTWYWVTSVDDATPSSCTFSIEIYMAFFNVKVCQLYLSGSLPSGSNMKNIEMCTIMDFDKTSSFLVNDNVYSKYKKACKSTGYGTFSLILISLFIVFFTTFMHLFGRIRNYFRRHEKQLEPTLSKSRLPTNKHYRLIHSIIGIFCPLSIIGSLILYQSKCISSLSNLHGSSGYGLCILGSIFFVAWWICLTLNICCNDKKSNTASSSSIRDRVLSLSSKASKNNNNNNNNNSNKEEPIKVVAKLGKSNKHNQLNDDSDTSSEDDKYKRKKGEDDDDDDDGGHDIRKSSLPAPPGLSQSAYGTPFS